MNDIWIGISCLLAVVIVGLLAEVLRLYTNVLELNRQLAQSKPKSSPDPSPSGGLSLNALYLAQASHELRTPINSIIGFSRVILNGIDGDITDLQRQDLQTIHDSGKHLLGLVNDWLDWAKLDAKLMELDSRPLASQELLESLPDFLEKKYPDRPKRSIQITARATLRGDEIRLRQALLNLVDFVAAHGTEPNSHLFLTAKRFSDDELFIEMTCRDGQRLDDRAWDYSSPLFSHAYPKFGMEMQLYLARDLILLNGGRMEWTLNIPQEASFKIWLPLDKSGSPPVPRGIDSLY